MTKNEITIHIDTLIKESTFHFDIYEFDEAEKLIQEAISLSKENGLIEKQAEALGELGYFHVKEIGNIDLARACYYQCIDLLKSVNGDGEWIAAYYYRLGNTHYYSAPDKVIELYGAALRHFSFANSHITQSRIYQGLGVAHEALGNLEHARDNYLKALDIETTANPEQKTELAWVGILDNLKTIFLKLGEESRSLAFKERGEKARQDFNKGLHKSS
jgi:tetratricopeptide (TPR) repeat protein